MNAIRDARGGMAGAVAGNKVLLPVDSIGQMWQPIHFLIIVDIYDASKTIVIQPFFKWQINRENHRSAPSTAIANKIYFVMYYWLENTATVKINIYDAQTTPGQLLIYLAKGHGKYCGR